MEESILTSTKKLLNISADDDSFDLDIITHINSALSHLSGDLGVGPPEGFQINDATETWEDFLTEDVRADILGAVKTNVNLQVRLAFDPPAAAHVLSAFERQLVQSDVRISNMREETAWVDPDPPRDEEGDPVFIVDGGNPSGE